MRARNNTRTTFRTTQVVILSLLLSLCNTACDAFSIPPCRTTTAVSPSPIITPLDPKHRQQPQEHNNRHVVRSHMAQSTTVLRSMNVPNHNEQTEVLHRRPFITSVLTSLLGVGCV